MESNRVDAGNTADSIRHFNSRKMWTFLLCGRAMSKTSTDSENRRIFTGVVHVCFDGISNDISVGNSRFLSWNTVLQEHNHKP